MTPEEFLICLIEDSLPSYVGHIHTGNGKDFATFLDEDSTEKPSAFISYDGFDEDTIYESGTGASDVEKYSIYLRTDDNIKEAVKCLKTGLLSNNSTFEDENGNEFYVVMTSGQAYRDNGSDAFMISVIIK